MAVSCCKNVEIPRISINSITKEEFNRDYLQPGVPVVFENATQDWPARHWTLDSLVAAVGSNPVSVRTNTSCQEYKLGTKYKIRDTTFGQYVADLKAGNKAAHNSYMAVQNIRKALPQIQNDMIIPEFVGKMHAGPYLWIAHQGHYEYCHFDPDDGFLVVINGAKQVRLFGCGLANMYANPLGSKGRTIQSTVDCEDPDMEAHPQFVGTRCHHCLLRDGDMLYIPAFWWHQVSSPVTTISINMFWGDAGDTDYLAKVMTGSRWPAFRHWLVNIVQQNVTYAAWPRTLSRLPQALSNFIFTQWFEKVNEEQMDILIKVIMEHLGIDQLPHVQSTGKHPPPFQIRGLLWRD